MPNLCKLVHQLHSMICPIKIKERNPMAPGDLWVVINRICISKENPGHPGLLQTGRLSAEAQWSFSKMPCIDSWHQASSMLMIGKCLQVRIKAEPSTSYETFKIIIIKKLYPVSIAPSSLDIILKSTIKAVWFLEVVLLVPETLSPPVPTFN